VKSLRAQQFREDQGPLAHPVRPEEYVEINNFYTATIYEKGAEVIRMLHTLLGPQDYRKALDLYFQRHDGQACTIEQFRQCFEDASGRDLSQFARWWSQAGTPRVTVDEGWKDGTYILTLRQSTPPTPGQPGKQPLVIPIALGLLGQNGDEVLPTQILELTEAEQSFTFTGLGARPIPSILRGFSAPVIIERKTSDAESAFLLAHDTDPFNRWEASHRYAIRIALQLVDGKGPDSDGVPKAWVEGMGEVLGDEALDPAFKVIVLEVPGIEEISGEIAARGQLVDPDAIHAALRRMRQTLAKELSAPLTQVIEQDASATSTRPYSPDAQSAGRRALKNHCLRLLTATGSDKAFALAQTHFRNAGNMSDSLPALTALVHAGAPSADSLLEDFHTRWRLDPLVIDKWLALQASAPLPGTLARIAALTEHPSFDWKNPNKFRALIGTLASGNPLVFHAADGSGYRFFADWLIRLDTLNPQVTARATGSFETFRRYDAGRQALMRGELERIAGVKNLSKNTREMVERMLEG
jgi:aminopeptidase N